MAGLHFGAGIDTSQWSKDVQKMRQDILSVTKEGEKVDLSGIKAQISIQKDAIKELEEQYKQAGKAMEGVAPGQMHAGLLSEHKKIGVALQEEKQSLDALSKTYESFAGTQATAITRQRALRYELYNMAEAGEQNTKEFRELTAELRELDKSIDSVRAMQNALRGGKPIMEALTGSIRAGVGAFTAFTGIMGLLNTQSERMQEIQTRLQSVMAISIGIEQTYQALLKEGRLIQSIKIIQMRALARAEALKTRSTIGATIAQKALNAVAKVNPYILLATAILSVVGALILFSGANSRAVKEQRDLNKAINDGVSGDITQFKLLQEQWRRAGSNLADRNEAIKDFNDALGSSYGYIEDVNTAENIFSDEGTKAFVDAMKARTKAEALREIAQQKYRDSRNKQDALDERRESTISLFDFIINPTGMLAFAGANTKLEGEIKKLEDSGDKLISETIDLDEEFSALIDGLGLKSENKNLDKKQKEVTKTLEQELNARQKLWEDYYRAVDLIGSDSANEIYGDEIDVDSSYLDYLIKQRDELVELEDKTIKQVEALILYDNIIADLTNRESPFTKRANEIAESAEQTKIFADRLRELREEQDSLGSSSLDLKLKAEIQKLIDITIAERKALYDSIMDSNKDFETIVKQINIDRANALDSAVTQGQTDIINADADKKVMQAYVDNLKNIYPDLDKVLTDIGSLTKNRLVEFRDIIVDAIEATDDVVMKNALAEWLDKINNSLNSLDANPIKQIAISFKAIKDGGKDLDLNKELQAMGSGIMAVAGAFQVAIDDIKGASEDLGVNLDSSFGDVLDKLGQTVEGIGMIGEGIEQLGKGNPLGVITAVSGVIKSVTAWTNSDRKKERQNQRILKQLRQLESAYRDLNHAIEMSLGSEKIRNQTKLIENLRQQQEKLKESLEIEKSKKNSDIDQLNETEEAIKDIEREVEILAKTIRDDLMTTDLEGFSNNLTNALVDAFRAGDDAAAAMGNTVDDMFRNIIRRLVSARFADEFEDLFSDIADAMEDFDDEMQKPIWDMTGGQSYDDYYEKLIAWKLKQAGLGIESLTEEQMKEFRERAENLEAQGESWLETLDKIFGITEDGGSEVDSLKGAIQGMSQQTADVLAGQFNAIRMDTSTIVSLMNASDDRFTDALGLLAGIKGDTNNLNQMRVDLSSINDKMDGNDLRSIGL